MDIVKLSNKLRFRVIQMSFETKAPHLASSLSCIELYDIYENVLKKLIIQNGNQEIDLF